MNRLTCAVAPLVSISVPAALARPAVSASEPPLTRIVPALVTAMPIVAVPALCSRRPWVIWLLPPAAPAL